jgi:uncharacterized protein involved in exopolysaccharide biosynthesis
MTLQQQLRVVARHRWWILLAAVAAAVAAFFISDSMPKEYAATTKVRIVPSQQQVGAFLDPDGLADVVQSYVDVANGGPVIDDARRRVSGATPRSRRIRAAS